MTLTYFLLNYLFVLCLLLYLVLSTILIQCLFIHTHLLVTVITFLYQWHITFYTIFPGGISLSSSIHKIHKEAKEK